MIITPMEGISIISPWTNIYQIAGLDAPGNNSISMDPSEELHRQNNQVINNMSHIMKPQEKDGLVSWGEGAPNDHNHHIPIMNPLFVGNKMIAQSQPFDAASSIDQSLECLLSGTNSTTETSDEDDGISMLFSSNCTENFWNFNSNNTRNNVVSPSEGETNVSNVNPRKRSHNMMTQIGTKRKRCNTSIGTSTNTTAYKKTEKMSNSSNNISFQQGNSSISTMDEQDSEAIQQMKEMIYRAAAFRPVHFGVEPIERPKRKNVRISNDPQTAAARQRRERISERLRVLQKLVPGGSKMDTASMLDEAANYLKFLRNQVKDLENFGSNKVHQFQFGSNNHFVTTPSQSLQFSPMAYPMQSPQFLPPNPNLSNVPKS